MLYGGKKDLGVGVIFNVYLMRLGRISRLIYFFVYPVEGRKDLGVGGGDGGQFVFNRIVNEGFRG